MLHSCAQIRGKPSSWSADINPDTQSGIERPNVVMDLMHRATATMIAALATQISVPSRPSGDLCSSQSAKTDNCFSTVSLQTRSLAAPHDPREPRLNCFTKRVPSRLSEPFSRSVGCAWPGLFGLDSSTCPRTGSWPTDGICHHTLHRQGSPQGTAGPPIAP